MRLFLKVVFLFIEFVGVLGFSAFAGLWWFSGIAHGRMDVSLLRATLFLILASATYYKHVITLKRHHTPFHFYFYTVLAVCTVTGYLYGVFFRWL
jgi:hypothetical protein